MTRSAPVCLVLVVAAVAMLGGCDGGTGATRTTVTSSPGDTPWSPDQTAAASGQSEDERLLAKYGPAPLDAYQWTAEESATIDRAFQHRVATCMRTLGFTYDEPAPAPPEVVTHWGDLLGLIDPAIASGRGYASLLAAGLLTDEPTPPAQVNDPSWLAALNDTGGCYEQADADDPVDPSVDLELPAQLYNKAVAAALADDAYRAAKDGWRSCMADAGYHLDDYPMPFSNDPPAKQPLDQAVKDVDCKHSSGAVDAFVTALYASETDLATTHADELRAYQQAQGERVRHATETLAG